MDHYLINVCPVVDPSLCVLEQSPAGTERCSFKLSDGIPFGPEYPASPEWQMSEDFPGLKAASLIATTGRILVVHGSVKDLLVATGVPMDVYPFVLIDHKRRVASREHFIVNPLGTRDCLNLEKSEIVWSDDPPGVVIKVRKFVLDPRKLENAPVLFRVKEDPTAVVMNRDVVAQLKALTPTPTNVYFWKLDQIPAGA